MRKIAPGFVLTGTALLLVALLLWVYFITYRPTQQHPEFEAQLDNPASLPAIADDQAPLRVQTLTKSPKKQLHHPDQTSEKKPGPFRRFIDFIKRLFGGGKKKGGSYARPFLRGVQTSASSIVRTCPPGRFSPSCEAAKSQVVQLSAVVSEADRNRLRYEWSAQSGKLTGNGYSATWDLSSVDAGVYVATVSVYDGNDRINGQVSVSVTNCADCVAPPPPCTNITMSFLDDAFAGTEIPFIAFVTNADDNVTYNWSVSNGKIVSGKGTSRITVDSAGMREGTITATVSVGGFDPSCTGTSASSTTAIHVLPAVEKPRMFMQYSEIEWTDEQHRLDQLAVELNKGLNTKVVIFGYGSRSKDEGTKRALNARNYLLSKHGISSGSVIVDTAGCLNQSSIELWIVPMGAAMPEPSAPNAGCFGVGAGGPDDTGKSSNSRATLSGRVTDKNGVALPNATVTLLGPNKFRKAFTTSSNGAFAFQDIPAGKYTLEITAPGLGTRRVEDLEVSTGVNLLPEPIQVFEKELTTRFKLRDVVRIGYPDHFLESPASEITFEWNREPRETEVVTSQSNTNGRINIVDRPPPVPGGTPDVPVTQAHGRQYTAYAKVTLIADGLTVISTPSEAEQSLAPSHVSWSWKVKPSDMNAAIAAFRFRVDLVWRGEGLKEQTDSYEWPATFVAKIGPPSSVSAAKYGAPTFAFIGLATVGLGFRKRKLLGGQSSESDARSASPAQAEVAQDEIAEDVSSSVFAPRRAACGEGFLVQVFAHLPEEDPVTLKGKATEAEPRAERVGGDLLDQQIKRGTNLTFTLSMKGLEIDEPQQSRVWRGRTIGVQFGVTVPKDFKPGSMFGLVVVSADTIPIGHFRFAFEVVDPGGSHAEAPAYVGALTRYQHAFISYAHQDRAEVLKRVQMLNLMKEKFFQDFINLEPGQQWEPAIRQAIDHSDVIFLFWSKAASASVEVRKEILYAMARHGGDENACPAIHPVIIEGPPPPPPPADLNFLHFDDKFSYWIFAAEGAAQREANE